MDGFTAYPPKSFAPNAYLVGGSFRPNAASNPSDANNLGALKNYFTTTYGATGLYTLVFDAGLQFPATPVIVVGAWCADQTATNVFTVSVKSWTNSTRTLIIQANQNTTAFQIPSDANNRINFWIEIINSTGK